MRTLTRAIAGVLGTIVVILGILSVLGNTVLAGSPLMDALGTGAANALIDATGIKDQVEGTLRENANSIAAATGLSENQVNAAIDALDISSWEATTLPADASATGSFSASYGGTAGTITTYTDPSYITVDALGQEITFSMPASAQEYLPYLAYAS